MKAQKRIEALNALLEKFINQTLSNFEPELEKKEAVKLEAWIAQLFLFDYVANGAGISQDFRQNFLEQQFNELERNYLHLVKSNDPLKTVENRFNRYAEIPMHYDHNWFNQFITQLLQNLAGSKHYQAIHDEYPDFTATTQVQLKQMKAYQTHLFQTIEQALPMVAKKGIKASKAWEKATNQLQKNQQQATTTIMDRLKRLFNS